MSEQTETTQADATARPEGPVLEMTYRNWRGETRMRRIRIVSLRFGTTEWHTEPGWLLNAMDADTGKMREFALADCDFLSHRPQD